jgi:hypothetical protein
MNILNIVIQNNIFYNPNSGYAFNSSNSLAIVSNNIFYNADPKTNLNFNHLDYAIRVNLRYF